LFKNLHQDDLFQQKYQPIMLKYMPAQEHLSWDANTQAGLLSIFTDAAASAGCLNQAAMPLPVIN